MTETVVSIQNAQFPDQYSLTLLFVLTVAVLILFIEIGFRLGSRRHGKPVKAQASQARAVMGAMLGLLAFMLAFTFATAQTHFETRVANLAEEARLAHNAFLHAEFLGQADHKRARLADAAQRNNLVQMSGVLVFLLCSWKTVLMVG